MTSEVYVIDKSSGRRIVLEGKMTVGRAESCDIQLQGTGISRSHGLFELSEGQLIFTDLGSSNGSFVNGEKLTQTQALYEGEILSIGDCELEVHSGVERSEGSAAEDDATAFISMSGQQDDLPAMWSDSAGLESDSHTQFAAAPSESAATGAYRQGSLELPAIGSSPRLVSITAEQRGQEFPLDADGEEQVCWNIGRDSSCDIVVADASVSGQHAQLIRDGRRWKVVNWMSTNGTFVNGSKGLSTYLKHGDIIGLGKVELAFELPAGMEASNMQTPSRKRGLFARLLDRIRGR
ncbi:MAG: hypothetical protein CMN84_09665 [Spongiibacteraceae bacterium]|nr:hypothetical protein [Spongiibacteraceae bacterium]